MLHELERMLREGELPDPRAWPDQLVYWAIGLAIGFWFGVR